MASRACRSAHAGSQHLHGWHAKAIARRDLGIRIVPNDNRF
jgi:hypothetical protein